MTPLAFVDCETTGVHPGRRAWEIAVIRRDDAGERRLHLQVRDVDLSNADPMGLKVGGFYERHTQYGYSDGTRAMSEGLVAESLERFTRGAHLVGVVPSFDAETFDDMLRRHGRIPAWHYHLIDVEAMAVGWLAGKYAATGLTLPLTPPWKSDELSRACGIEPPPEAQRHTAMGDAEWAMRWYDALLIPAQAKFHSPTDGLEEYREKAHA